MDYFLSRYRNLTVLLLLIVGQLVLLGYQQKSGQDVRFFRVWSVWFLTPFARVMESTRLHTFGVFQDYFVLLGVRDENRRLRDEVGKLKMQNQFLESQLSDAERARALVAFQSRTPSKTLAARVISNGTGANSATVFVDRGSDRGVEDGMAVVTPEGIVGKVIAAYPSASLVLLVTDPTFAAGVISQKGHVSGTLKGQGHGSCAVEYIQNEQKIEPGEWFFTSGYDRVFPRGFPVGQVSAVRSGRGAKEVFLNPSGLSGGLGEVLIVLEGTHQAIPDSPPVFNTVRLMAPLPESQQSASGPPETTGPNTQADSIKEAYKKIGVLENHQYGITGNVPNFNVKLPGQAAQTPTPPTPQGVTAVAAVPKVNPPNAGSPNGATGVVAAGVVAKPPAPGQNPTPNKPPAPSGAVTPANSVAVVKKPAGEVPKKPRPPVLETDPADADPAALEVLKSTAKPKATDNPQ